jgi:glycosyltransferase involved in cell wall biosynthesis
MDEWAIGELFSENDYWFDLLSETIETVPDIIHVEQPWLLKFAHRYVKKSAAGKIKIIYGSQNVEHEMKFDIVKSYFGTRSAEIAQRKTLQCEISAIEIADIICCVSQSDVDWTRSHTLKPCILAPNGVKKRITTTEGIREANKLTANRKFAIYCASGHPPNMNGFFDIFGGGMGCISPDELIVIAGSAGPSIIGDKRYNNTAGLSRSCISAGTVTEECLQGLLENAHAIILPLTQGGGTNLKTAEALWAGKHIIATNTAMRGFEQYISAEGVLVADKPVNFLAGLRDAMQKPPHKLSEGQRDSRKSVLWEETLKPLVSFISST